MARPRLQASGKSGGPCMGVVWASMAGHRPDSSDFGAQDTHEVHLREGWRRSGERIFERCRGDATNDRAQDRCGCSGRICAVVQELTGPVVFHEGTCVHRSSRLPTVTCRGASVVMQMVDA